jgi:hypothetical protein|tara:strand:+ start:1121 stop:1906 length:786 start_codon:yes stop_codon:yes gene_type:complete
VIPKRLKYSIGAGLLFIATLTGIKYCENIESIINNYLNNSDSYVVSNVGDERSLDENALNTNVSKVSEFLRITSTRAIGKSKNTFTKNNGLIDNLKSNELYIVLIEAYPKIKTISEFVGLEGKYGHLELIYNGKAYGSRPPRTSELSIKELESLFKGSSYEIRQLDLSGDFEKAVNTFRTEIEGTPYNLYYNNCTGFLESLNVMLGGDESLVPTIDLQQICDSSEEARMFAKEKGLVVPDNPIWFPDQYSNLGDLVVRGRF